MPCREPSRSSVAETLAAADCDRPQWLLPAVETGPLAVTAELSRDPGWSQDANSDWARGWTNAGQGVMPTPPPVVPAAALTAEGGPPGWRRRRCLKGAKATPPPRPAPAAGTKPTMTLPGVA